MKNILLLVESYWGRGHMNVAVETARALVKGGAKVTIAASESSFKVGDVYDYSLFTKLVLPGLIQDADGKSVLTQSGRHLKDDAQAIADRIKIIADAADEQKFDATLIEAWPFGVDVFDKQFRGFAGALKARGVPVYGIAREVLGYPQPRGGNYPFHDAQSVYLANHYLDKVYVLGDPSVCTLEDSMDGDAYAKLRIPVDHIGFVGPADANTRKDMPDNQRPVIIDGGGSFKGVVRDHMLRIVAGIALAQKDSSLSQNPLLITLGKEASDDDIALVRSILVRADAPVNSQVVRSFDSNVFRDHVCNAALMIHKGGRNTAVDSLWALQSGPVAQIITPLLDESGKPWAETDMRSAAFEKSGFSVTLNNDDLLSAEITVGAIEKSVARAKALYQRGMTVNLNGAATLASALLTQPSNAAQAKLSLRHS